MENTIYLSSAYLAPVEYYTKLFACEKAYVEQYDNYVKQTYRNRCVIAAADGPLALTIPTEKSGTPKCLMKDVRISDHGNWRHIHWKSGSWATSSPVTYPTVMWMWWSATALPAMLSSS